MKIFDIIKKNKEKRYWKKQMRWAKDFCSRAANICNKECENCAWGRIMKEAKEYDNR